MDIEVKIDKLYNYIQNYKLPYKFIITDLKQTNECPVYIEMYILYDYNVLHKVSLIEFDGVLKWHVFPYNDKNYKTRANTSSSFGMVLKAIEEHYEIHLRNKYKKED